MAKSEVVLPAMGEGIIEATIMKWLVETGTEIEEDDPLVEIATDKVDSEIPSPVSGILSKVIYKEGEIPKVGEVIAIIETEGEKGVDNNLDLVDMGVLETPKETIDNPESVEQEIEEVDIEEEPISDSEEKLLSPLIRSLAKERTISLQELKRVRGTGLNGRITRDDLYSYIKKGRPYKVNTPLKKQLSDSLVPEENAIEYHTQPGEKLVPMDRTRKLIAEHMVRSKRTSPHVTSMIEVDITHLVQWRESEKNKFKETFEVPITYTAIIVEAVAKSLKQYPGINVSVAGDYIVEKKNFNIGVATALKNGNLIVPVIRNADHLNLPTLASKIFDLAARARTGKLEPSDIKGGTFTVTNMGQFGNITGTPIINQPEVAILAVGAIKKKPGVIYINNQETIGVRDIIILSLTYDHRVLDGALGGLFLKSIGDNLEKFSADFW